MAATDSDVCLPACLQVARGCRALALPDLAPAGSPGGGGASSPWVRYVVALTNFADTCAWGDGAGARNATFAGCPGTPVARLAGVRFSNALGAPQRVCLDGLRLLTNLA